MADRQCGPGRVPLVDYRVCDGFCITPQNVGRALNQVNRGIGYTINSQDGFFNSRLGYFNLRGQVSELPRG